MSIAYEDILKLVAELKAARRAYLVEHGWTSMGKGRWYRDAPHGSGSTRRIEADTKDAVNWQSKFGAP